MSFPNRPNPNRYSPYRRSNQNLWDLRPDQMSLSQRLELENIPIQERTRAPILDQPTILGGIPTTPLIPEQYFRQQGLIPISEQPAILSRIPDQPTFFPFRSQSGLPKDRLDQPAINEGILRQEESPQESPSINPEDNQHLYQILDRAGISMEDIHDKPWTDKEKSYVADPEGKSFIDKKMFDFLKFTKENPTAPSKEVKDKFNCVGQNCMTNTIFGLSKLRARTEGNVSPRSEVLNYSNNKGDMDLDEALGMGEKYHDQKNPTLIPKGTTAFLKNPTDDVGMPFDHVIFAEKEGNNAQPIYRSLNSGQKRSELQTLQQVLDQGKYKIPPYESIFSGKYRYFFK